MTTVPIEAPSGVPFAILSRPQRRFTSQQTVSNLSAGGSFAVTQLSATGWVRRVSLLFTQSVTVASAGAVVAGDGPWNLISAISLSDATGQPIVQPISGYNLYLVNKYMPSAPPKNGPWPFKNPHLGPEFAFAATATTGTAVFRLDIEFEIDEQTGYGSIPNLDSNASLQLRVDFAPYTNAFSGVTPSAASLSMRVTQEYWAPVGDSIGGVATRSAPPGAGDYLETRYETQTVTASAENLISLTNKGGLIRGVILASRAAGARTAFTAGANVGFLLDNQDINSGITLEDHNNQFRQKSGYFGADLTTSYAPLGAGVMAGIDRGVVVMNWDYLSGGRDSWLNTRAGSQLQARITPGAAATQLEVITVLAQAKELASFYDAA